MMRERNETKYWINNNNKSNKNAIRDITCLEYTYTTQNVEWFHFVIYSDVPSSCYLMDYESFMR